VITYLYTLHTVAKPLWGLIAERVHVRYCIAGCYAGGALGVLLLVVGSGSLVWLVAFATVYGLTRGAQSFVTSLAWADYFAARRRARSAGWPRRSAICRRRRGRWSAACSTTPPATTGWPS